MRSHLLTQVIHFQYLSMRKKVRPNSLKAQFSPLFIKPPLPLQTKFEIIINSILSVHLYKIPEDILLYTKDSFGRIHFVECSNVHNRDRSAKAR